jgi:hypothetical protein
MWKLVRKKKVTLGEIKPINKEKKIHSHSKVLLYIDDANQYNNFFYLKMIYQRHTNNVLCSTVKIYIQRNKKKTRVSF